MVAAVEFETARILAEIGGLFFALGIVTRVAMRFHVAASPIFLLVGLLIGNGGVADLDFSQPFIGIAAEVGAVLLLFFLGLEFSARTIVREAKMHSRTALVDIVLNGVPGAVIAWMLGWGPVVALAMAGVTYVSSSGISTQVAREMGWKNRPEWKSLVAILVLEDLVMAPYLPIVTALAGATSLFWGVTGVGIGLLVVTVLLIVGARGIKPFAKLLKADSSASLLLTAFGLALLAGGVSAMLDFSSAVAAFLVGLLITGDVAEAIRMAPLRDVFAAGFFVFFGLQTDPADVLPALPVALLLVIVTWITKVVTVYYALRRTDSDIANRRMCALRGGSVLSARGEFSVAIGALVVSLGIGPEGWQGLVATYVIISALFGPFIARFFDRVEPAPVFNNPIY
jgi:CPA2 family monovalent cation:H+ antiporter-2